MNDSVNCQMWRSCKACTPGTLLILCPRSDMQMCGGVACSKTIPYLHTWREGPVTRNNSNSQRRSGQNKCATNMVTWSGHTESDLRHCYDNQHNNSQQGKARIQVEQECADPRALRALWTGQNHHQALDQSQDGGA